jgi:II/X family phage/plasmid replication protein
VLTVGFQSLVGTIAFVHVISVKVQTLGHNIEGGPRDPIAACRWLINHVQEQFLSSFVSTDSFQHWSEKDLVAEKFPEFSLPDADEWRVRQVDWAEVYEHENFEQVQDFFTSLKNISFPRRKVDRYGLESVNVPARSFTLKLYHKGPEFSKHDHNRLKKSLGKDETRRLQDRANILLRSEISIRRRLIEDIGDWIECSREDAKSLDGRKLWFPRVKMLTTEYLEKVHDLEMSRLLKEGQIDMEIVRTRETVIARLRELHEPRLARVLFATWLDLALVGEKQVLQGLSRTTFYRHRAMLLEAGCSWQDTDVHLGKPLFANRFVPLSTNSRCVKAVHPFVVNALESFKAA